MLKTSKRSKENLRKSLISILWFLIRLNIFATPLYLILFFDLSFAPFQVFTATMTKSFLNFIGYNFVQQGHVIATVVSNQLQQIEVSWDSTGWKSLYALAALVLATPFSTYRKKFWFLLFTLPLVFLINFARIITTIVASIELGFQYFNFIHLVLWSGGMIAVVLGLWYYWVRKEKGKDKG